MGLTMPIWNLPITVVQTTITPSKTTTTTTTTTTTIPVSLSITDTKLHAMSTAPRTGEHIIVVDKPTGFSFGYSGPGNSLQSFADVVHWYPGWVEGNELAGWYSSSYGGDQKTPFSEEN